MTKIYAIQHRISTGSSLGPAPWSIQPPGVELLNYWLYSDEKGVTLQIDVRCEEETGKAMGWIPFERPRE
jgi:hypothetical protein